MYAGITAAYLPALRGPHQQYGYVEAWRSGVRLTFDGSTRLPLLDGTVTVDGSTPGVRRTLSATFPGSTGLWDFLSPIGTELRAYSAIRYPSGDEEAIPQGVFDIDVQNVGYASSGDIKVTAADRWVRVQRGRFLVPRASAAGATARAQIASLINQVMPTGIVTSDQATSTATVPNQTWEKDRAQAIQDVAKAASLDVYFDRNGAPVIRDAPVIDINNSVWTVDASETGVLIDANRQRDRQNTFNLVVVNASSNDGSPQFATVFCWDSNRLSPTYCGPADVPTSPPSPSQAGPFGQRATYYSSSLLRNQAQAVKAGNTVLAKVSGLAAQLSLTNISNAALDDGDTITVQLPRERRDLLRPVETHIIDKLTVPLVPTKTAMTIDTRSTLADYSES